MTERPCVVVTEDDLNAELAMIDENLCRTDMTLAEVEDNIEMLRALMKACEAPVVRAEDPTDKISLI